MIRAENGILLTHSVIVRSPSLLPMKYKLTELSDELNISRRTLEEWLEKGLPYTRDGSGNIWVIGTQMHEWIQQLHESSRRRIKLAADEAYCLKCRSGVRLVNTETTRKRGKLVLIKGLCPNCGKIIHRGGRNDD